MTNEELITGLGHLANMMERNGLSYHQHVAEGAIKALEQKDVLKKVREEIEVLPNANPSYTHTCDVVDREDVLDIIDKYREGGAE